MLVFDRTGNGSTAKTAHYGWTI